MSHHPKNFNKKVNLIDAKVIVKERNIIIPIEYISNIYKCRLEEIFNFKFFSEEKSKTLKSFLKSLSEFENGCILINKKCTTFAQPYIIPKKSNSIKNDSDIIIFMLTKDKFINIDIENLTFYLVFTNYKNEKETIKIKGNFNDFNIINEKHLYKILNKFIGLSFNESIKNLRDGLIKLISKLIKFEINLGNNEEANHWYAFALIVDSLSEFGNNCLTNSKSNIINASFCRCKCEVKKWFNRNVVENDALKEDDKKLLFICETLSENKPLEKAKQFLTNTDDEIDYFGFEMHEKGISKDGF
ncbi:hypothetical protein ABK040_004639 [Willaertia magna]